jgi:nucleotide-binding universal stress UspA family protein
VESWLFHRILVAHDGSEGASRAFDKALALALVTDAELHLILVGRGLLHGVTTMAEVDDYKRGTEERFRKIGEELMLRATAQDVDLGVHVRCGHEIRAVIDFIRRHECDLLVISSESHAGFFRKILGNPQATAQELIRLSPCTVMVVK